MTPLSLAILGAGRWGTHLLRNFLAHPQVTVRAVVDPSPQQLTAAAERFDLANIALLSDWQAALALPGLTAVAIATPAATHFDIVAAALGQGLHVLVEKPLTLDPATSAQLCDLAQGSQLVVDHTYLFHSAVRAGAEAVAKVGPRRYGYATRTHLGPVRSDVDALWDLAIHDIAIFNHWLQEQPQQVQAQGQVWQQVGAQPPLFPTGLADVVWCRLLYPSGFEATLHLGWANPDKQRRLGVVGDRGTLIFDELAADPLVLQAGEFDRSAGHFVPTELARVPLAVGPGEPLRSVCDHFVTCAQTQQPSTVSGGAVGTALVRILTGLSTSLNQGGGWVSLE